MTAPPAAWPPSPEELWRRAGEWCDSHLRPWAAPPPPKPPPTPSPGEAATLADAALATLVQEVVAEGASSSAAASALQPKEAVAVAVAGVPGRPRKARERSLYLSLGVREALLGSGPSAGDDVEMVEIR